MTSQKHSALLPHISEQNFATLRFIIGKKLNDDLSKMTPFYVNHLLTNEDWIKITKKMLVYRTYCVCDMKL